MNKKAGLEYFPLDVDFFQDEKIMFVSAKFGTKGEAITIRLICKIYRQGYFVHWDDDAALLFTKSVGDGCQHSCVKDVVYELLKRGFFDKDIFERFSVLTSRGIQKRYIEATIRRKDVQMIGDFLLIDVSKCNHITVCRHNVNTSNENVYILNKNVDILKQSKVKESKVKESKEDTTCSELSANAETPSSYSKHSNNVNNESKSESDVIKTKPEQGIPNSGLSEHADGVAITLTLNDKTEHEVLQSQINNWSELYPVVDVMQELRSMKGWLDANPKKRKTKKGINSFINAWLARTQDKGGRGYSPINNNAKGGENHVPNIGTFGRNSERGYRPGDENDPYKNIKPTEI